jgi:5'-3' exonuclease
MVTKTQKELKPLIDGDVITYRAGFAADSQIKRQARETNPDITDEELREILLSTDYAPFALQNVKTVIEDILDQFNPEYKLYVHAGGNFRDKRATIKPYKGNRDPNNKPKYYKEIKEYMFDQWNAIPVRDMESDDAIGIEQFDNSDKYTVICSIDKDMLIIPGWHYHLQRRELKYQTIKDANNFFFWQMLVGDAVDNIPGIKGIGPKRADALLADHGHDTDRIRAAVKELYQRDYGEGWSAAYQEIGDLLYILRRPHDRDNGCPLL